MPRPVELPLVERRAVAMPVECRTEADGAGKITGYAAVTERETVIDLGFFAFREKIAKGAFKDAIKNDDVRALFNHDPNFVLGRNTNGTLRLKEDDQGLRYEADTPDTQAARDVRTLIARGDVSGSSFAFTVENDDDVWDDSEVKKGKLPLRTIRKVSLYDVSPVTYPAYEGTSVSARSRTKMESIVEAARLAKAADEQRAKDEQAAKSPEVLALEAARSTVDALKPWRAAAS
jgi:HK97 family phage prohead protease